MGEILLSSVPPSNLHLGTLEGLFELSRHPARAPDLPRVLLPELKDTVICAALGVEVPGHRLKQLTLMLRLLKACFFTHRSLMMKSQQNRIELVTRPVFYQRLTDSVFERIQECDNSKAVDILDRILKRDLYKMVAEIKLSPGSRL